jgi:hypothetical protein
VVELWPELLSLLSLVVVSRSGGQDRRAQNQRSESDWPPRLVTPRGGSWRAGLVGKTPATASDQKQRKKGGGGARGGGWIGRPEERLRSIWRKVRRSWMTRWE